MLISTIILDHQIIALFALQWWPATLERRLDGTTDGEGRTAYVIAYDANSKLGYPDATESRVTFLDDHELYDLDYDEIIQWKIEGDPWNAPEDKHLLDEEDVDVLVSSEEMRREEQKISRLRGISTEDAFAKSVTEVIADLPPDRQRYIASNIQSGMKIFTEEIRAAIEGKADNEKIVTLADMESALQKIRDRMQGS